jgi:nucleoside-diphosphate-sugar epimerase
MRLPLGTRRNGEVSVRRFAKPRILIVGCGDVGLRLARRLNRRFDVIGTARSSEGLSAIRATGARALQVDLDQPLPAALSAPAPWVVHLAPPAASGTIDRRTRRLIRALRGVSRLVYVSTSGVYGDCRGALVDETHLCEPASGRATRRLDAERALRNYARAQHVRLSILRVPGIYALERLPRERLAAGLPALNAAEDVFTNHIHADDLALILEATLHFGRSMRLYNASDDSQLQMGDYFDRVADALSLPRPPRSSLAELRKVLSPIQLSFMEESRRLVNRRLKDELGVRLLFPTLESMLRTMQDSAALATHGPMPR